MLCVCYFFTRRKKLLGQSNTILLYYSKLRIIPHGKLSMLVLVFTIAWLSENRRLLYGKLETYSLAETLSETIIYLLSFILKLSLSRYYVKAEGYFIRNS